MVEIDFEQDINEQLRVAGWKLHEGSQEYKQFYVCIKRLYNAGMVTPQVLASTKKKLDEKINSRKIPIPGMRQKGD